MPTIGLSQKNFRRGVLTKAFALVLTALTLQTAQAQQTPAYPTKPIRIMVGFAAGGAVDVIARALGQRLTLAMGQNVIVENKPGAGSNLAIRATIDAPADGYTLVLAANGLAANPTLFQPPPFDPERDLTPITLVGRVPIVMAARPDAAEVKDFKSFIASAKANPGKLAYGSPGNGSTPHLAVELFAKEAGVRLQHIPYKGGTPAITDVIAGHLPLVGVNALEVQPHVKSGKLKVLMVLGKERSPALPDAPTLAEQGYPGFEAAVWYGVFAPTATPQAIVERLHSEVQKAMAHPEFIERLKQVGGDVLPGPRADLAKLLATERARYAAIIREANIKPD